MHIKLALASTGAMWQELAHLPHAIWAYTQASSQFKKTQLHSPPQPPKAPPPILWHKSLRLHSELDLKKSSEEKKKKFAFPALGSLGPS